VKVGIKIIYYSGDLDSVVPITGTLSWFDKYRSDNKIAIKKNWRPWVTKAQNISGMVW
jgi:serine carboxypeptidase-like clade 2